uniref:Gamma-glutamylcyclotransferase family protein n=1 Tax=Culicoides sonorensis TaxID=179676 RepID=A0A336K719_CULSO
MSLVRVFLYGTLKRGQPNYHWLTNPDHGYAKFICDAITVEKFPLIIASRFNIPFLLNIPGKGHQIKGEVYEIDEKMLHNLDKLEDYPSLYGREVKRVRKRDGTSEIMECVTYYLKNPPESLLKLEFLDEYLDSDEKKFKPEEYEEFTFDDLIN